MTRDEFYKARKENRKAIKDFYKNRANAYSRWEKEIKEMKEKRPDVLIVMHHNNFNDPNYELWSDCTPMFIDDHFRLHKTGVKRSEEEKMKQSISRRKKIICIETGEVFESADAVEISIGAYGTGIVTNHLNRPERFKTVRGKHYKRYNESEAA